MKTKLTLFAITLMSLPGLAFAINEGDVPAVDTISGTTNVTTVLVRVINFFLGFAAAVAVLFIVLAGILYMTSSGNDDKTKKAKGMLWAAIIGLIIVVLALVIVNFTKATVNKIF